MTYVKAIKMLERLKNGINFEVTDSQAKMDALNMAIRCLDAWEKIVADIGKNYAECMQSCPDEEDGCRGCTEKTFDSIFIIIQKHLIEVGNDS